MDIVKQAQGGQTVAVTEEQLEQISRFSRRPMKAEEVYCFSVRLCDNQVDRDGERFPRRTLEELAAEGFAPEIIEALRCLTHAEEEPYDRYIARIKGNPLAVAVKLNDLTDNMDIRRLPYLSDKDVKRLKRYLRAYKQLTGEPTYSVYACRQEYPNAYLPWTEAEDLELTRRWCEGATEVQLSAHFQRKPGAIRSRIEKLDLERLYGKPNSHD